MAELQREAEEEAKLEEEKEKKEQEEEEKKRREEEEARKRLEEEEKERKRREEEEKRRQDWLSESGSGAAADPGEKKGETVKRHEVASVATNVLPTKTATFHGGKLGIDITVNSRYR